MIGDRLRQAQQDFEGAEMKDDFVRIPDGEYPGMISNVTINEDKLGVLRLYFEITLTDMNYTGRKVYTNAPLEGQYIGMSKKYLKILGFDIENFVLESLPTRLSEILYKDVIVALVTKRNENSGKDFQSAYINRLAETNHESTSNGMF